MSKHQEELFHAETTWFHVFKDMIESGDVAKLEHSSTVVYLVVKSYTNFSTGRAFPALETIAEKAGLSERQVRRALDELQEFGYISKEKTGRHNTYTLREKVSIKDEAGRPQAVATWDYIPNSVRDAVADLKHVMVTGDMGGAKIVHIEHLVLNVMTGDNATQVNINAADFDKLPQSIKEQIASLRAKAKARNG